MAARVTVELSPKLRRLLQRLPADIVDPLKAEIAESADLVFADAQRRVPVKTGALRDSLGLRIGSKGLSAEIGFSSKRFPRLWKKAGWRAKFVELGTKGGGAHKLPRQGARPFLRPAFDANQTNIVNRHRAAMLRFLAKATAQ